jgi:hypothetical protein
MVPDVVGLGAGKRELTTAPNVLRIVTGRTLETSHNTDSVMILETNVDDVSGEVLGHALEQVLGSGARDAWVTPASFKKNRPGHVLHLICDSADAGRLADLMMQEIGTLGVRYQQWNRFILQREIMTVKAEISGKRFDCRVKIASDKAGRIVNVKPEFDDIQRVARELSMPVRRVSEAVLTAVRELEKKSP